MQVSSYLIIPLIASQRENKLPCAVRGKKTRLKCMRRRRQVQQCYPYPTIQDSKLQQRTTRGLTSHMPGEGQSDCS